MDLFTLLIILCFITAISAGSSNSPHSKPDVFINCGSVGISTAINGKEWTGDKHQTIKGTSSTTRKWISGDPVIYKTARISHSNFFYTFHVNPGQKILRLHFNPTPYKGFTTFKDLFTVEAAQFILLQNFSASLTAQALDTTTFTKEFYLSVEENQPLILIFTPTTTSPSQERTYAFVNGIEIISVTSHMSYFQNENLRAQVIGQKSMVYVDNKTALELIHRLNVKHESGSKTDEFDTVQIWKRSVHVGFRYLIRIHFSEIGLKIAEIGHLMFKIVINDHVVETSNDAVRERHETAKIRYRDYLMVMKGRKEDGQRDLTISLESNNGHMDGYEILKGFEILKVSNPDNSLATPNPVPPERNDSSCMSLNFFRVMGPKDVIATIATMVIFVISIISYKLREMSEMENREEENKPSARAERHCQRFSLAEIQLATRNFSDAFVIGRGGFGKVYKGNIDGGNEIVAIKRLNAYSSQGGREFLTEIETLSELQHINLVSLIGYCNERKEMILVYKYMKNGTLSDHLYKLERKNESRISLTWKQRLNICVGAGRGLEYLHTGHRVIHCDVKPSNILLDENFIAKVADFGLAKPEDRSELQSYVITQVKGTPGYLDPYYISDHRLTRKSDVYAFGVVLFEVLCGRPAVDQIAREEERFLTKWALSKINKGEVNEILDLNLIEEILPDSLKVFVEVAESCLHNEPNKRPTMAQVVVRLEFSLELQESGSFSTTQSKTGTDEEDTSSNDETFVHTHAPTDINIANSESTTETKYKQKNKTNRTRRFWPWDTIGKRSKPSKEEESVSKVLLEFRELGIEVRKFDIASIAYATNQFSTSNRTRELGYSTIYKAVLPTGQKLAVKRYSSSHSIHMLPAFKSEILSLSHVQHCNIIKLLGYCVSKEELMVVYEFMENQNLDTHLYAQRSLLHWDVRFKIIVGIAKGIIYLHQDSGMRIIHRDIKPSSISLDAHMNPKICDFSLAITFDDDQSDVETRVVGTIGFVDPDYMMSGNVSVMSDVYSFGVLILETVSGKRIWKQQGSDDSDDRYLVHYAWRLWKEGTALDLVDKSLNGSFSEDEALRCIQVGLLCIHREPRHRPTMPSALKMLLGDMAAYNPVLPVSWSESTLESNDSASASA